MGRKNAFGKYIISASEVGSYVVCPEAWRLKSLQRKPSTEARHRERSARGDALHREWANTVSESQYLSRGIRIVILLVLIAIALLLHGK